ncbi:hypothetical protein A3A63_04335 [Candidatus Gottesmanbacteria bacterium RIFCSPLOWO2_01_FULL_46_9]|uniref:Uncharacterized protein n=1 Tax=Candidatus Gottesmanbacteria bacterium RIFCSPLOWO2_01_FULL_46_9 TaxID=1798394 RepID=A0A1F6AXG9_9BACT|nr:MAG: hypothetical protein A3A63_04335 [Candidatus Gottesmanbacteria bacterium RIFCSPLOWO2_01_FULL_46_9]
MKLAQRMHYMVLCVILGGGVATFLYVRPNPSLQFAVGVITSFSYVAWGLIHHALHRDLHQKIVVEYLLIGTIAVVLLATIIRT